MPVIRSFRQSGRYIEDFEELYYSEYFPLYSAVDTPHEEEELPIKESRLTGKRQLPFLRFLKKWLVHFKFYFPKG